MREPNEIDLAYAAGFLDGEGCSTIISEKCAASIRVAASNTNKPVLLWLQEIFGGCVAPQYRDASKQRPNTRKTWVWNVDTNNAVRACNLLLPFLKEKAEQARLLLDLHSTKQPRGRRKLPTDIAERRHKMVDELRRLKRVTHARKSTKVGPLVPGTRTVRVNSLKGPVNQDRGCSGGLRQKSAVDRV